MNFTTLITATDTSGAAATGYTVDMTLPFSGADASDKLCRYTGTGQVWDCAATSSTANSVTRAGITQLSPWTVGNDAGPNLATFSRTSGSYGNWPSACHFSR